MAEAFRSHLFCPKCDTRHVDEGEFATRLHHVHECQNSACGFRWRVEPYTFGIPEPQAKEERPTRNEMLTALRAAKKALRRAVPYISEKIRSYDVGDRPMSPPADMLRADMEVSDAISNIPEVWVEEKS